MKILKKKNVNLNKKIGKELHFWHNLLYLKT